MWYVYFVCIKEKEKNMTQEDLKNKIQNLYLQCQEVMSPRNTLLNGNIEFESMDELSFYIMVSDFFLQKKQKELLRERELEHERN